jgi:hypothetical protein
LCFSLLFPFSSATAQEGGAGFVQLTLNRNFTIPFFEAFFDREERPYLHFDALMTALELPIRFEGSLGSASGFLADGTTRLILNLERQEVEVGKVTHRLPQNSARVEGGRLYILWSELGKWLPVRIAWSVEAYEMRIATQYRLPSEERKKREQERQRLLRGQEQLDGQALYPRELPLFEPGMMELNTGAGTDDQGVERANVSLTGVHLVLQGDLEYSVSRQQTSGQPGETTLDYARLKYYDDLREKELAFGDTFAVPSPLLLGTVTFRGASFFTGGRLLRFGRTTIIGTAPVGSEVDLYRRGVLIAFTRADQTGFYRFDDVPLGQDASLFEIRVFTPQGRRFTEFKLVSSQEEMMPAGGLATQGGTGSSIVDENPFSITSGEARYGLFRDLTLGAYVLQLEDYVVTAGEVVGPLDTIGLFLLGRPLSWLNLLVEQAKDSNASGSATRLAAFFAFQGATIDFERQTYEGDFAPPARTRNEAFTLPALLLARDQIAARTRIFLFNTNATVRTLDFGEGREVEEQELRLDRALSSHVFINLTLFQDTVTENGKEIGGSRTLEALTTYRLDLLSRAELLVGTSSPVQGEGSTRVRANFQKVRQQDSPWGYQAAYTIQSGQEDLVDASVGYLFGNNIRVDAQADNQGAWTVSVNYALPFRVSGAGVEAFPPGTFGRSGLSGAVYLDENGDGRRQDEEPNLSEVRILAPGIPDLITDERGQFMGWGLPAGTPVPVEVDLLTTDALFVPARDKYLMTAHPGELVALDIPLVPAGGLTGIVTTDVPRSISPANGVEMTLQKEDGTAFATVQVEWDGTFIIEGISPGTYALFGKPEHLAARGLELSPEKRTLTFPAGGEPVWLEEVPFTILKRGGGALPGGRGRSGAAPR